MTIYGRGSHSKREREMARKSESTRDLLEECVIAEKGVKKKERERASGREQLANCIGILDNAHVCVLSVSNASYHLHRYRYRHRYLSSWLIFVLCLRRVIVIVVVIAIIIVVMNGNMQM